MLTLLVAIGCQPLPSLGRWCRRSLLRVDSTFAHEEWLARRAVARFFPQVVTPAERSCLYYLSTWHDGATLQQHLDAGRHFTIPEVVAEGWEEGF